MVNKSAFLNWSGGKDAAFSLYLISKMPEIRIHYLLTTVNNTFKRISMHGVREELLKNQAESIHIPLKICYIPEQADMNVYNQLMAAQLKDFYAEKIRYAVFGDIFLEDLRKYREGQLKKMKMKAIFPLWGINTSRQMNSFIDAGFKAVITCVNARKMDRSFAGREIDHEFLKDLPDGVDPCGENGEFHTFVYDGPIFRKPVRFTKGAIVERTYPVSKSKNNHWDNRFFYSDLLPLPSPLQSGSYTH